MSNFKRFNINSKFLERDVQIVVRIPDNIQPDIIYDTIYMHDASTAFFDEESAFGHSFKIQEVLEKLEKENKIDKTFVVAFSNNTKNAGLERFREYSFWDNEEIFKQSAEVGKYSKEYNGILKTRGQKHMDFLIKELIPKVEKEYNIGRDRHKRSILGSSMGGLSSLSTILLNQDYFSKAYCLSNAFWYAFEGIEELVKTTQIKYDDLKIYLDVGDKEESSNIPNINLEYVKSNKKIYSLLKEKNLEVKFKLIEGGEHNEQAWNKRLEDVLLQFENKKE